MGIIVCPRCTGRGWVHKLQPKSIPHCPPGRMLVIPLTYAQSRSQKVLCPRCLGFKKALTPNPYYGAQRKK